MSNTVRWITGFGFSLVTLAAVAGCSCNGEQNTAAPGTTGDTGSSEVGKVDENCTLDQDADGYGEGCLLGPDCDDNDPLKGGVEICDSVDNDCDESIDEGLVDVCEVCSPECNAQVVGGGNNWNLGADNSGGGITIDDGVLTLTNSIEPSNSLWIANTGEGTVSKLDATTGKELARYPSVIPIPSSTYPFPTVGILDACTGSACAPSRTAIDQEYNAYVANRAFGHQPSVTKYAERVDDCIDKNDNDSIETSHDENGDGQIDTGSALEYFGVNDECILWTAPVGEDNDVARALAVGKRAADAKAGWVWVGLHGQNNATKGRKAIALDPDSGQPIDQSTGEPFNQSTGDINDTIITLSDANGSYQPYGMATGVDGRIWLTHRPQSTSAPARYTLAYVMPGGTFQSIAPVPNGMTDGSFEAYGIAIDRDGNVYIANSNGGSNGHNLWRYSVATDTWDGFSSGNISGSDEDTFRKARGVAVDDSNVWVTLSGDSGWTDKNILLQFRLPDGQNEMYHYNTYILDPEGDVGNGGGVKGVGPVGVGIAPDRSIWAIAQQTAEAVHLVCATADCECAQPADCTLSHHPVGTTPYTYSDFTGFGLNVFADPGYYRFVTKGCADGSIAHWDGISYEAEGPVASGDVKFRARTAGSEAAFESMADNTWVGTFQGNPTSFQGSPGPLPDSRYIQVEIILTPSDPINPPRIKNLSVVSTCSAGGEG